MRLLASDQPRMFHRVTLGYDTVILVGFINEAHGNSQTNGRSAYALLLRCVRIVQAISKATAGWNPHNGQNIQCLYGSEGLNGGIIETTLPSVADRTPAGVWQA